MVPSSSSFNSKHGTDGVSRGVTRRSRESNGPDSGPTKQAHAREETAPRTSPSPEDGPAGSPVQPTCPSGNVCRLSAAIRAAVARIKAVCRLSPDATRRVLASSCKRLPVARDSARRPALLISKPLTQGVAHSADASNSRLWIHQREKEHRRDLQKRSPPASMCMCLAVLRHGRGEHTSGEQRAAMAARWEACVASSRAGCSGVARRYPDATWTLRHVHHTHLARLLEARVGWSRRLLTTRKRMVTVPSDESQALEP